MLRMRHRCYGNDRQQSPITVTLRYGRDRQTTAADVRHHAEMTVWDRAVNGMPAIVKGWVLQTVRR